MSGVGRYVKFTAQPGRGDELAQLLLRAAESLIGTPGCELYLVNRSSSDPDQIWVTELWLDQASLDASLEQLRTPEGQALVPRSARCSTPTRSPSGSTSSRWPASATSPAAPGTRTSTWKTWRTWLPRFGLGEQSEARFATRPLGAVRTGVSHQRLRPGVRQAFGHRHRHAEEIVLILAGGGRVKIDDEVRELKPLDAIRFSPGSTRAFEAGPDGLEFVVFGPHHRGDAVMDQDFWPTETAPQ